MQFLQTIYTLKTALIHQLQFTTLDLL